MLGCFGAASAQQAALTTNLSGKPFFQSVALNTGQIQQMDFIVRSAGSVTGRVFADEELASAPGVDPQGIAGVRVTLRSRDAGFSSLVVEQFTDDSGTYDFQSLRPGKYTVEVDPANLLIKIDIPVTVQRRISGTVFIDNDGDALYQPGIDTPVDGAQLVIEGRKATSDASGAYELRDLPPGRVELLVRRPEYSGTTHVRFDLFDRPATNRVINIPMKP